jgi:hypothetical protein
MQQQYKQQQYKQQQQQMLALDSLQVGDSAVGL